MQDSAVALALPALGLTRCHIDDSCCQFFDRQRDVLQWRLRELKRGVELTGMRAIEPGEHWNVSVGGEIRKVKVTGVGDMPGHWKCVDLETGLTFYAQVEWFVEPAGMPKREGSSGN